MKIKTPYNAGDLYRCENHFAPVMICGHVWWPVEQRNAYHCVFVDEYGIPRDGDTVYVWDTTDGKWPVFTPLEKAA